MISKEKKYRADIGMKQQMTAIFDTYIRYTYTYMVVYVYVCVYEYMFETHLWCFCLPRRHE